MLQREDNPWYPTMRLFRQKDGETQAGVIARVAQELAAVARGDMARLMPFKADGERRAAQAAAIIAAEAALATAPPVEQQQAVNPGQALLLAEQKRRHGFLADADELTRRAAAAAPDNAEAEHMLGIIAHQSGKLGEAIEHVHRAIAHQAGRRALSRQSRRDVPARRKRSTRRLRPAGARSRSIPIIRTRLSNLGIALFDQGKFEEALELYDRADRARRQLRPGAQQPRQCAAASQAFCRCRTVLSPRPRAACQALPMPGTISAPACAS